MPFERFAELKSFIESQKAWLRIDGEWSYFEKVWKPKSWSSPRRFIFIRHKRDVQRKGPVQLDLFEPLRTHA